MDIEFRIKVLDDQDFARLREIADKGTLNGSADVLPILRELALSLHMVGTGQKQITDGFVTFLEQTGMGTRES